MTASAHVYSARVMPAGVDLGQVSGQITLDASGIPHVSGDLTFSMPDSAALDLLDPRDGARIEVTCSRANHWEKVYSPWAETSRNLCVDPSFEGANDVWSFSGSATGAHSSSWAAAGLRSMRVVAGSTNSAAGDIRTGSLTSFPPGIFAGGQFTISAYINTPASHVALNETSASRQRRILVFIGTPGGGVTQAFGPQAPNTPGTHRVSHTLTIPSNATGVIIAIGCAGSTTDLDFVTYVDAVQVEAGASMTDYVDGSREPAGELQRTRWLGPVNASQSVLEQRSITGLEPIPATTRVFDLGVREVRPDRSTGTVQVEVASDEAILSTVAPLADNLTPRTHETSLRAVCDYVLGKIGASLEPGTLDADVTAFWRVTNLLPNPSFEVNLDGWLAGSGSTGLERSAGATPVAGAWAARWRPTSTASAWVDGPRFSVTPGRPYTFSAYMIADVARQARLRPAFVDADGRTLWGLIGAPVTLATTQWKQLSIVGAVAPVGAVACVFRLEFLTDAASRNVWADCCMAYEGDELVPYIDGALPAGPAYTYEWTGPPHASTSARVPVIERPVEALTWRAGVSGMDFLEVLLKQAGMRLVCDEQRRWWLRDAAYRADGEQTWRYGANIIAADERLSLTDWYGAAVYEYVWSDPAGIEQRRIDSFELVPPPAPVLRMEVNAPYPGPGRAENLVRRAQGRGRTVTVTGIPTWTEHTDQPLSVLLDGTPIQTGIVGRVEYLLDDDTVTVASRTTDTPAAAWILIPDGERWTDSPVGESWTEEII